MVNSPCACGDERLDTTRLWLSGGDIGGTSTATNPLTTSELFVTDGAPDGSYRVGLHLSSRAIFNQTTATDPADVVLAGWDRLAADGTLTGDLSTQVGGIVLPRSITAIGRRGSLFGARVLTPDGQYAAAALTRNDGALGLSDEAMLTPPGGTLLDDGHIEVGPTHATIDGVARRRACARLLVLSPASSCRRAPLWTSSAASLGPRRLMSTAP